MADSSIPAFPDLEHLGSASGFVEEIHDVVKTLSPFEGFSTPECTALCEYMECFGAPSNATILGEDNPGDFLIIILTGQVDVVKAYGPADKKVVAHVGPGGFVGEMSLVDGQRRFASCVTTEPTDFAVLTRGGLNEILVDHPRLGNKVLLILLQLMTSRLRDATTRMLPTIVGGSI
jgi:CRP/FNR family cyclic AMP-dependent transcriptional regulator